MHYKPTADYKTRMYTHGILTYPVHLYVMNMCQSWKGWSQETDNRK